MELELMDGEWFAKPSNNLEANQFVALPIPAIG